MPNFIVSRPFIYVAGTIIDPNQNNPNETTIYGGHNGAMSGTAGHTHSGAVGDGPLIGASGIDLTANYNWTGNHTWSAPGTATFNNGLISKGHVDVYNGFDFRAFSDTGITKKYSVDGATGDVTMIPAANLFFDNGTGNVKINSPNGTTNLDFYVGASLAVDITTTNVFLINKTVNINSTFMLNFDGGGGGSDTFLQEFSANVLRGVAGGTEFFRSNASGEILFQDIDPPTANYANRNSIVKAWINMPASGTTPNGSYNILSVAHVNGSGIYNITFNTAFANTNYSVVATAKSGNSSIATADITSASTVQVRTWDGVANVATDIDFQMIAIGDQ